MAFRGLRQQYALRPARLAELAGAAWLMSRAFTTGRAAAAIAWFASLVTLIPFLIRRAVYLSPDGDGLVIVCRRRPALDVALSLLVVVAGYLLIGMVFLAMDALLGQTLVSLGLTALLCGLVLLLLLVGAALLGGNLSSTVGRGTPRGRRWVVAALTQRPDGAPLSALLLVRRALRELPRPGDVIVAVAADDALRTKYLRAGFSAGTGRRVHRIVG